jgi:Rieske Fe-S protein
MNPRPNRPPLPTGLSRRTVLGASMAGAAGAAGLLSACGGGSDARGESSASASPSEASSSAAAGGALVKTSEVPVNGGVVLKDKKIVVTQPTDGDFKAFTAVCTHMACLVGSVKDGVISCPCHGSQYSAADGSVKQGPAPKALAAVPVKVEGDEVVES